MVSIWFPDPYMPMLPGIKNSHGIPHIILFGPGQDRIFSLPSMIATCLLLININNKKQK